MRIEKKSFLITNELCYNKDKSQAAKVHGQCFLQAGRLLLP